MGELHREDIELVCFPGIAGGLLMELSDTEMAAALGVTADYALEDGDLKHFLSSMRASWNLHCQIQSSIPWQTEKDGLS